MSESSNHKKKKRFAIPDAFIIIFGIALLAAIATYIIPSGEYEREEVDGVTQAVADSYQSVDANPTNLLDLFLAILKGMIDYGNIIFLFFIIVFAFVILDLF